MRNTHEDAQVSSPRERQRNLFSLLLWYLIPSLIIVGALGYIFSATVLHVNPPIVPVEGVSMHPTLVTGDLVFLEKANPSALKVGNIIAVHVPQVDRTNYGLPANVVHRIVRIEHSTNGLLFITKGDANSGADVFQTRPGDVIGKLRYAVPGLGYPFLFVQSRQGEMFLGAAALLGLLYFLFGLFDDRRAYVEGTMRTMQAVLAETERLERVVTGEHFNFANENLDQPTTDISAPRQLLTDTEEAPDEQEERHLDGADPAPSRVQIEAATVNPDGVDYQLSQQIVEVMTEHNRRGIGMERTVDDLAVAIGEYAVHLRSHTSAVRDLAQVAAHLDQILTNSDLLSQVESVSREEYVQPSEQTVDLGNIDHTDPSNGQYQAENVSKTDSVRVSEDLVTHEEENLENTDRLNMCSWDAERWEAYVSWRDQ